MINILFVCHGNICRSPMAEMVLKDMVRKAGLAGRFSIASRAATTEEIGHDIYPPARRTLDVHHIPHPKEKPPSLRRKTMKIRTISSPWTRKISMTLPI